MLNDPASSAKSLVVKMAAEDHEEWSAINRR